MLHFVVLNNVLSIDYFKKLINLQIVHYSLAWLGVYMLGYYNFSIGWMITPLLLRWTKTTNMKIIFSISWILDNSQIYHDFFPACFAISGRRRRGNAWRLPERLRSPTNRSESTFLVVFIFVLLLHVTKFQIVKIQAMLEARMGVEELPSWVFFPDKERAEWVNTMLKQVSLHIAKKILLWWRNNKFDMMGQYNA